MKKTSKRIASGNRGLNRLTDLGVTTDDSVLADLRATRDDTDLRVMPLNNRVDDEDAIDRLLVNSGFEKVVTSMVQPADMTSDKLGETLTAIDDFEPEASAYRVVPVVQDPHVQVRLVELEPDSYDGGFKADRHVAEELGIALVSPAPDFAEADVMPMFDEPTSHHNPAVGQAAVVVAVPAPTEDTYAVDIRPEPNQPLWNAKVEPTIAGAYEPEMMSPLKPAAADRGATVQAIPINDLDSEAARQLSAKLGQDNGMTPAATVTDDKTQPYRCEYKAEQTRINVLALILAIVASLAALVCYFLLMDMRNDLNKLNEMVEIMKEDIQINRQEPPVE